MDGYAAEERVVWNEVVDRVLRAKKKGKQVTDGEIIRRAVAP